MAVPRKLTGRAGEASKPVSSQGTAILHLLTYVVWYGIFLENNTTDFCLLWANNRSVRTIDFQPMAV